MLAAAGCSTASQRAGTTPPLECVAADPRSTAAPAATVSELRRTVEAGPLYAAFAAGGSATTCRVGNDSGSVTLEYTFGDGASLRVTSNPQIEYTDQDARLETPLKEDPVAVLRRAEQSAFGGKGCGIEWRDKQTQPADGGSIEDIYRGDICNCQARVRRNAAGEVKGLLLRSAC